MRLKTFCILLTALALSLACSRAEEKTQDGASAAAQAAGAAATSAQEAADAAAAQAREAASKAAAEAKQGASDAAAAAGAAAADLTGDPVAKCSELAARGAWSEALEVCKKAHEAEPDNLAIEHALQQAQAAARE